MIKTEKWFKNKHIFIYTFKIIVLHKQIMSYEKNNKKTF